MLHTTADAATSAGLAATPARGGRMPRIYRSEYANLRAGGSSHRSAVDHLATTYQVSRDYISRICKSSEYIDSGSTWDTDADDAVAVRLPATIVGDDATTVVVDLAVDDPDQVAISVERSDWSGLSVYLDGPGARALGEALLTAAYQVSS